MKKFILGFCSFNDSFYECTTQIIAHRGYFQTQPPTTENSITSLQNAQKLKIYGSEFDVRMSKDGVLVINHDEHHGKMEISETDFKELAKLKLSNGEKYPTLKDYLKAGKRQGFKTYRRNKTGKDRSFRKRNG
ncbi:glycerophosphodiester phosphodiesterase family protein [Chryseobacterium indoltheticum]|uniref:glycerophosphodiester phosphodiesterase family protein n=1 Tax=Chryseobacterium indoltheticum TaxID=254 RepID=UPI003F49547B